MSIQQEALPIRRSNLLTTGLALFSMFFGAGNLIFPLLIGREVGGNVWYAVAGLGLTAVVVPFLGLAAMVLFEADYSRFFGRIGRYPGIFLLLLLQLILGPLGVIPRLVTLMHAIAKPFLFEMSLGTFSVLAGCVILGCSFNRQRLVGFLGGIFTPILLLSLIALVSVGLFTGSSMNPVTPTVKDSFTQGLLGGYNTMDLIAAFLFATVILPHFQKGERQEGGRRGVLRKMFLSSLIAASLLFLTYVGLCLISAYHGWTIDSACPSEQLISAIAIKVLGPVGGCIAAVAVLTACLTTAMTLTSIFADYLRKDLCKGKIHPTLALLLTVGVTGVFANLGFAGIAAFLGPILQVVYPGLILLTLLNLLHALYGQRMVRMPVYLTFTGSAVIYLF